VADHVSGSTMGAIAAQRALETSGVPVDQIDLIITANSSPERVFPSTAALIQNALGARPVAAFDLNAACSGFVYGLNIARQFVSTGTYRTVLVVGSEVYSRILNWQDRSSCVLFGDGAGAAVVQASTEPGGILSCVMGNESAGTEAVYCPSVAASPVDPLAQNGHYLVMNGQQVYKYAVRGMIESARSALNEARMQPSDLDLIIPHQANLRMIQSMSESLGIPEEKVFINVDRYGNTAGASIPIALCEAVESGRLQEGDRVALICAGAGISYASMVMEWQPSAALPFSPE
ncbi:MAG: beta-ketoacyl-ACP synthase III, partial [Chloroflexota bacterium]